MAKRAREGFVIALAEDKKAKRDAGKYRFNKDEVVPDDIADKVAALCYDDGAPAKSKRDA